MKKKGILFTVTTIFLLLAVFVLSSAYLTRNNEQQRTATLSTAGDKLIYIKDDATSSIYSDLLSINLESIVRGTDVAVIFSQSNLSSSIDHNQIMQDYETFIEGTYATLNNINIELSGFNNSFSLSPYNSTFIIDRNMFYVYTENPSNISRIRLVIAVDALNISDGQPGDTGGVEVEVGIIHNGGEFNASAELDPAAANSPFYVNFENNSRIEVNFGSFNSQDGVLRINASGLEADISHMEFRYNLQSEKVIIKGGNISITSAVENITKQTEIIIAAE